MTRRPEIDGRKELVRAARTLFAEQGVDAVSIRAVNRAAGLGPAAAHYHFGTKDGLLQAVLHEYGDRVVGEISRTAEDLLAAPEPATARQIVHCLADPYLALIQREGRRGLEWIRIVNQLLRQDSRRVSDQEASTLTARLVQRSFPDAATRDAERATQTCVSLFVSQLSAPAPASRARAMPAAQSDEIDFLLDFLSGGLVASLASQNAVN